MVVVSVVIPTYDMADVISRAIDSVLSQTLNDFELIVVDDCSQDRTQSVVKSYDDPRIQYTRHEVNRGGSAARNTGIGLAEGKYVAFLDADDEWLPAKLEKQVRYLDSKPEQWVGTYCGFRSSRRGKLATLVDNVFPRTTGKEGGSEMIADILLMRFAHGGCSSLLVKKEALDRIDGFDESFQRHQDWEFLIRLLHYGKLGCVDELLLLKYGTSEPDPERLEATQQKYLEKFSEEINTVKRKGNSVIRVHRFKLAKHYFREGIFSRGAELLLRSECPHHRDYLGLIWSLYLGSLEKARVVTG